jgi:hypothetical protein
VGQRLTAFAELPSLPSQTTGIARTTAPKRCQRARERHPAAEFSAACKVTGATSGVFVAARLRGKQCLPRILVARRDSNLRASTRKPYPTPRRLPPKRIDLGKRFSGALIEGVDPTALPPAGRPPASCHHSRARDGFGHEARSCDRTCARPDLSVGSCRGRSCDRSLPAAFGAPGTRTFG